MEQYITYSEGQFKIFSDSTVNLKTRCGQVNKQYVIQEEITPLGFSGVEFVDYITRYYILEEITGGKFREGARDGAYKIDGELTPTGFNGSENTDWKNFATNLLIKYLPKVNVIMDGHSFMSGYFNGTNHFTVQETMLANFTANSKVEDECNNVSVGGSTVAGVISRTNAANAFMSSVDGVNNVLVLWIGINDLTAGGSASTVFASLEGYVDDQIANGYDAIILFTATRSRVGYQDQVVVFNNLMREQLLIKDNVYLIDCDKVSELEDVYNATYFDQVGLPHPKEAGYVVAGNELSTLIENLYNIF